MGDFTSDVSGVSEAFRQAASDLDNLLRQVGWAAQDALDGNAKLPESDDPRVSREQLALEYAARTLSPATLRVAFSSLESGSEKLRRLLDKVVPPEVTLKPPALVERVKARGCLWPLSKIWS